MPFYELTNTETNTYICTIQGELKDIHNYFKIHEGKYSLESLNILKKDLEDDYSLKLYHVVDNDVDYYLLADNMKDAKDIYYIYCCARLRKFNINKIANKRFLRCLCEDSGIVLTRQ